MNMRHGLTGLAPMLSLFLACTGASHHQQDLIADPFPEAQAELREVVQSIAQDIMTANIEGLQAIHLDSEKFTKFGPRSFDRQDVVATNESEATFFSTISDVEYEVRDLRIDVFGDFGVVTYYPHVSFVRDGMRQVASARQTLVFLKTVNGWKLVHEHGTARH